MTFEVFNLARAREELDRRSGPLVRWRMRRFELNRPARDLLLRVASVGSDLGFQQRGALLLFDYEQRQVGLTAAPPTCDPALRQAVTTFGGVRMARSYLTDEWPMAVDGRDFVALYGMWASRAPVPVTVVDQAEGKHADDPSRVWGGPLLTFPIDMDHPETGARALRAQG